MQLTTFAELLHNAKLANPAYVTQRVIEKDSTFLRRTIQTIVVGNQYNTLAEETRIWIDAALQALEDGEDIPAPDGFVSNYRHSSRKRSTLSRETYQLIINNPELSAEDVAAVLRQRGLKPNITTIVTLRAHTLVILDILTELGRLRNVEESVSNIAKVLGQKGGIARMARLSRATRRRIAKMGAKARWEKS